MAEATEERVVTILKEKYEDQIVRTEQLYDFLVITLRKEKVVDIIRFLYQNAETKYQFLTTIACIHYPDTHEIAVMYQLHNLYDNKRLRLKVYLPEENPVLPTLTSVFAGANWMEREAYDFYGVTFEGHPDLKRILNVEDMIIFPLRKEYPLEDQTRDDKNDLMFGR